MKNDQFNAQNTTEEYVCKIGPFNILFVIVDCFFWFEKAVAQVKLQPNKRNESI